MAMLDYGVDPLTIGPVSFSIDECPESIPLGVSGVVVKHTLVGGSTTTQKLGARVRNISWDGKFFENALSQAGSGVRCVPAGSRPRAARTHRQHAVHNKHAKGRRRKRAGLRESLAGTLDGSDWLAGSRNRLPKSAERSARWRREPWTLDVARRRLRQLGRVTCAHASRDPNLGDVG